MTAASQARILGANDRIRVAGLGTGGRGTYLLNIVKRLGTADIVTVCDVYTPRRAQARAQVAPDAREVVDYREVLDDKSIDAVVIGAPDHWHVPMTIDAVRAGKDVYVEKPVTHSMEEAAPLTKAVTETGRIVQCGMQQRSWAHFAEAKALINAGELGQVTYVRTYWYQNHMGSLNKPNIDLAQLDWKRWLGNAPARDFDPVRYADWRWFWDYGGGALTDLFAHWIDVVHWIFESDGPSVAMALGNKWVLKQREMPDTISASFEYPKVTVGYDGSLIGYREGGGLILHGTKAMMRLHRGGYAIYPELTRYSESPENEQPAKAVKSPHDGTPDHMTNFFDCLRSRKQPNAPIAAGIACARAGQMGNIAMREKRVVNYPA